MPYRNPEQKKEHNRQYYRAKRESILAKSERNYQRNKARKIEKASERRKRIGRFLREQKQEKCCVRCDFANPRALMFHHRYPAEKELTVARAYSMGWSEKRILAEIAKCEILCANCHMIEHASGDYNT